MSEQSSKNAFRESYGRVQQLDAKIHMPVKSKEKITRPRPIDIIFHKKNWKRSRYYFTSGHEHLGTARNVNEERSPFVYPHCMQMHAYSHYTRTLRRQLNKERWKIGYKDQQNYKTLQTRDLLKRLRIDVELELEEAKTHKDLDKVIAMTDVDPHFFTELSGREVREKFTLGQYIDNNREILRTKLLAGHERDECIRIDQQFVQEKTRLKDIEANYRRYVAVFEAFLADDHAISMKILDDAEQQMKKTRAVTSKRNLLTKEFSKVRLEVYFWEEKWRLVKMCQKFLYQVSPQSWRYQHDWIHRSSSGQTVASTLSGDLFGRRSLDEVASLDSLIEMFQEDITRAGPTEMYFENPLELIHVFRAIEEQNLNALIQLEALAAPIADLEAIVANAQTQMKHEYGAITEAIDDIEAAIRKTEDRASSLEAYANHLLHAVFRDLVCSQEVLHLYVFIEDSYENCIATNDAKLDSYTMLERIEALNEDLNRELDQLPREVVAKCEKEGFQQETKALREAESAAKKFDLMHQLLDALRRIMETPLIKRRPLMRRSIPVFEKVVAEPPPPEPTKEEQIYLTFFTDYCPYDDFIKYREKFPDDFDLSFRPKNRSQLQSVADESETEGTTLLDVGEKEEGEEEEEEEDVREEQTTTNGSSNNTSSFESAVMHEQVTTSA